MKAPLRTTGLFGATGSVGYLTDAMPLEAVKETLMWASDCKQRVLFGNA